MLSWRADFEASASSMVEVGEFGSSVMVVIFGLLLLDIDMRRRAISMEVTRRVARGEWRLGIGE